MPWGGGRGAGTCGVGVEALVRAWFAVRDWFRSERLSLGYGNERLVRGCGAGLSEELVWTMGIGLVWGTEGRVWQPHQGWE